MTESPQTPRAPSTRVSFFVLLGLLVLGSGLTAAALISSIRTALLPPSPTPQIAGITAIIPPETLADFTLVNQRGEPTRLSDFNGRWTLLFFGYTHCPDFCPLTLAENVVVKQLLGDAASNFSFVFTSVDGERDTPQALERYVTRFDPEFIGLTGTEEQLLALGQPYGLFFQLNKEGPDDTEYTVDHSTLTYVIDPQQQLHSLISFDTEPAVIAEYLKMLVGDQS